MLPVEMVVCAKAARDSKETMKKEIANAMYRLIWNDKGLFTTSSLSETPENNGESRSGEEKR